MSFSPSKARAAQDERFKGDWKVCRRSGGCEVLLIPSSHPDFRRRLRDLERQYRQKHGLVGRNAGKEIPDEAKEQQLMQAISDVLMRDWRAVVDESEQEIPFTAELAHQCLKDIVEFRTDVLDLVSTDDEVETEEREAVAGN